MSGRDDERAVVMREVGGNEADCTLVCNVLEVLVPKGQKGAYDIKRTGEEAPVYVIRVQGGLQVFTAAAASKIRSLSLRITEITILFAKKRIHVTVVPSGQTGRPQFAAACTRKWQTPIDWAASLVTDADDVFLMESIVKDVYSIALRMPDVRFWFEPIAATGGSLDGRVLSYPAGESSDDSEASTGGSRVPENARVGYSLCFANMPDVDASFFRHLDQQYGARVAAAYAWLDPLRPPLLVVNVRRSNVPATLAIQHVVNHVPKPLVFKRRRLEEPAATAAK